MQRSVLKAKPVPVLLPVPVPVPLPVPVRLALRAVTVRSARAVEIAAGEDVDAEIAGLTGRIGRRKHGLRSRPGLLKAGLLKAVPKPDGPKPGGIVVLIVAAVIVAAVIVAVTGSGRPYRRSATCSKKGKRSWSRSPRSHWGRRARASLRTLRCRVVIASICPP